MTFHPDELNPVTPRTVGAAQAELGRISDELRPDLARALTAEVTEAEANADRMVNGLAATHHDEVQANRTEWLEDLCGIRDDFAALEHDIRHGRINAAEARKRWEDLHREHGNFRASVVAETERRTALVTEMEDDPVAYADGIYERMPNLSPKFSF